MIWASIDPGIETGWALWRGVLLIGTGIIVPDRDKPWLQRTDLLSAGLEPILKQCDKVVCEWPRIMEGSDAGMAAKGSGAVLKLMFVVGRVAELAAKHLAVFQPVEVQAWKGNLNKEIVEKRVRARMPGVSLRSHEYDAVGIGLYVLGRFG